MSRLAALQERTRRIAPAADVTFIPGDCNVQVHKICKQIPAASKDHKVLGLCFVDPFDLGIKFETLKTLSGNYLDFVCLLALHMDANRNISTYVGEQSSKIDEFLGTTTWRTCWSSEQAAGKSFPKFLAEQFVQQMKSLGYIAPPLHTMKEVRSGERNLPLYHLALFSRSALAYEYWEQVLKYSTDQLSMF